MRKNWYEFDAIKEQFIKVIQHSQNIPNPKVDELFEDWFEAKERYIDAFGGKLIWESEEVIEIPISKESRMDHLDSFLNYVYFYSNQALADFIEENRDSFFDNKVSYSNNEAIPVGMKLLKAFKFFESDERRLRDFQDRASKIIQEGKVKGKLCLSVHPLDYLSVSVNAHNWRSCHSLDGDYRSGNLGYMVDKSTIVCYLKHSDDVKLPLFPDDVRWNSKVWRVLWFFSDNRDIVFAGRQYPFESNELLRKVWDSYLNPLFRFYGDYDFWNWEVLSDDYAVTNAKLNTRWMPINGRLFPINEIVNDAPNSHHFNDLLKSSYYIPKYSRSGHVSYSSLPIMIGAEVKCLHCGTGYIDDGRHMLCDICSLELESDDDEYITCGCCGARVHIDDAFWLAYHEEYVCDMCYQEECVQCDACGESVYKSWAVYDKENDKVFCKDCWEA